MNDENKNTTTETSETTEAFDPIKEIENLKKNMISRAEYDKIVEERNKYAKALIEGTEAPETPAETPTIDVKELRKDLFSKDLTNLDFAEKALALRSELIETKGIDIFVPSGAKISPTNEDYVAAQKVADGLQSCVEVADGDPEIFTRELMRITKDVALPGGINPKIKR